MKRKSRVRRSLLEGGAGGVMEEILDRENPDIDGK